MKQFSRRDFIQSGALVTATCAASTAVSSFGQTAPATGKPSPIHLGLAGFSFHNYTRAQLIDYMKQNGLTALNAKNAKDQLPSDPQEEMKALADYAAAGIHLHAVGTVGFTKNDDDDIRAKFEYAKRAGVPVIVAGGAAPAMLFRLEKFVRQYNIKIAIHNHGPEDKLWPSPLDVLKAVKNMDPRMGCCMDIGHAARAGTNVVEAIHAVGPRLFNMHMKDLKNFDAKESSVAVGAGIMPVREIFEALIATKYRGFVDLEYEVNEADPIPGITSSFAYLRGVLAGMGYRSNS